VDLQRKSMRNSSNFPSTGGWSSRHAGHFAGTGCKKLFSEEEVYDGLPDESSVSDPKRKCAGSGPCMSRRLTHPIRVRRANESSSRLGHKVACEDGHVAPDILKNLLPSRGRPLAGVRLFLASALPTAAGEDRWDVLENLYAHRGCNDHNCHSWSYAPSPPAKMLPGPLALAENAKLPNLSTSPSAAPRRSTPPRPTRPISATLNRRQRRFAPVGDSQWPGLALKGQRTAPMPKGWERLKPDSARAPMRRARQAQSLRSPGSAARWPREADVLARRPTPPSAGPLANPCSGPRPQISRPCLQGLLDDPVLQASAAARPRRLRGRKDRRRHIGRLLSFTG